MEFSDEEINELKKIAPSVSHAAEGGYDYLLLEDFPLPDGCQPAAMDVLLCPQARDGYSSRLYFASQVTGGPQRNWNGQLRALERNWCAMSWQTQPGLKLADMVMIHLKALRTP